MDSRKYLFVGNREYVLKEMIRRNLNVVSVLVMKGSFLEKRLEEEPCVRYQIIKNKGELINTINDTTFDVLVSNGNKYILPISEMKDACYVNIHPSFLPDLKGKDPINGACLFGRTAGAACHLMDDNIDTGEIISRIEIPMSDDLDAAILYQLSFKAEVLAFNIAYDNGFEPLKIQPTIEDSIYYSMNPNEWYVDFSKGLNYLIRQVRAFGYKSHGVFFSCNRQNYKFYRISIINNCFVTDLFRNEPDYKILLAYEDAIVFKYDGEFVRLDGITDRYNIKEGMYIDNGYYGE